MLWDVYADLKDADYRRRDRGDDERCWRGPASGRDSTVVFYGYAPALGFWLMKLYGHHDVRILDCSRDAWRAGATRGAASRPRPAAAGYVLPGARTRGCGPATRRCGTPSADPGTHPAGRAVAGRVRGASGSGPPAAWSPAAAPATSRPRSTSPSTACTTSEGRSGTPPRCAASSPPPTWTAADELITYCTIGGRACTAWFVLTYLLGRDRVRVYDGSWAEWGRMADTPVEQA